MIMTKEGNVDITGLGIEVLADLSVIISTLKTRANMSDALILQAVMMGLNNDNEKLLPEQEQEVKSWLRTEREKAKGGNYGN